LGFVFGMYFNYNALKLGRTSSNQDKVDLVAS
jgi:hypothetical protein